MAASEGAMGQRQVTSAAATADAVDVILRDGSTLRPYRLAMPIGGALVDFFVVFERSLHYAYGLLTVDERLVDPVLDPDWVDRELSLARQDRGR